MQRRAKLLLSLLVFSFQADGLPQQRIQAFH
jgi:hypothetical protein